ncbi:MAG: alcohol dehydrogenase [Bacteroides sp. SM23_62]|nr:MAG: alcohol dehydrogenase [Bacteroides sp. SM23_62]
MKHFNYHQSSEIVFGSGRIAEAGQIVRKYGNRCLMVTTPDKPLRPLYERVKNILAEAGVEVAHFDGVIPNPTTETSAAGSKMAKEHGADVILGLGGGSSMDAAKAIAVEATHEGSAWDYLFYKEPAPDPSKVLPVIAVSTTSGTGSQVTQVSVITNTAERDKSALYNPVIFPKVAIVDPELMITLPVSVTAPTGFDVFSHAFESMINPGTGAYVTLMAKEAIQLVIENLPRVLKNGSDLEAREKMALADTLAGLCIASAGVTLPHGMGMAIGGMYPHVAHGEALAILYPACTRYTADAAVEQYAFMARALNPELKEVPDREAAGQDCAEIVKFLKSLGLYKGLRQVNMPEDEIEALAKQSMVLPDYEGNPRVATYDEMVELVKEAYFQS